MKKNYLILSSIKKLWPKNNNNIIFNSIHDVDNICETEKTYKSFKITKSHWIRGKKLKSDYLYLNKIYEKHLVLFKNELNNIHNTNFSTEFWRILIGHWLSEFLHIYFDRWKNINYSLKNRVDKCNFIKTSKEYLISENVEHFLRLYRNAVWVQILNQEILKEHLGNNKINYVKFSEKKIRDNLKNKNEYINPLLKKSFLTKIFFFILKIVNSLFSRRSNKFFIYKTYLGTINEFKLSLKLGQFPFFDFKQIKIPNSNFNHSVRNNFLKKIKIKDKFEKSFLKMAIKTLPKSFLEDFNFYQKHIFSQNLPKNPKIIFSSNALWYNSLFQFYTALSKEKNLTKLIYAQHGGTYGISQFSWPEDYEVKTSDKWLSWGWSDKAKNIVPFFTIIKKFKINNKKKTNLLILLKQRKRLFHSLESSSGIESFDEYIKFQSKFLFSLNDKIKKSTLLRVGANYLASNIDIYSNLENKFRFYNKDSFEEAANKSKLLVHTINSTTMLEGLMSNIPSIIILNKKTNPFRKSSEKFMKDLLAAKILHYDPISAAKFVEKIWSKNNINNWWYSKKTQKILKKFNSRFAKSNTNIVNELKSVLTND